jgi:hypothetical protein
MNAPLPLEAWLDQAWNDHADAPQRVSGELQARAATLPADAHGLEALRLAEHVMLSHLVDPPALEALLGALPPHPAFEPFVQRAQWALALLAGQAPPPAPAAARWRALHGLVTVWLARGEPGRAQAHFRADCEEAATADDLEAVKVMASSCHNLAQDLQFSPRGTPVHDALMLEAARASRAAWERAGTWLHIERSDYRLACCHAELGLGEQALVHAQACLARCEAHGAEPSERFFAHEAVALAHRAAGDAPSVQAEKARMQALLAQVEEPGMHRFCEETLAKI